MLAYQQQQAGSAAVSPQSGGPSIVSAVPPASASAANSRLRFGNTGIASWTVGQSSPSKSGGHGPTGSSYRVSPFRRSQQGSRRFRDNKPSHAAPQWQRRNGAPAFESSSNTRPLRRVPNTSDISKQWRAVPAPQAAAPTAATPPPPTLSTGPARLAVNTAKAAAPRDLSPIISSTFQDKNSPLVSGISLALNKHKVQPSDGGVAKPNLPRYDVPQQRTPHLLSPADSMKTPGYIDPESLPFELGTTITDPKTDKQYALLSVLGEGSYAVVYLARCSHDGAKYALKCLSKLGLTARQLSLQRTELEIHASVCPHPHIVTLFAHFETREWLFLVMERVAGPDLYDYITQHPSFNANQEEHRFVEATRLFEQMIDAVAHIHALKAYHRDLKPENFILGADGNLKLTDFGLATRESLSEDFECGSKPYMSYENRNGGLNPNDPTMYGPRDDYSPRLSDVWALGVLFLNLLFAQSPWTDPSRTSCFKFCRFLREGAGFLVNQFPKLPREVADFLVTRVFSPESGRCNVLELKQWVQDLEYPFNSPKAPVSTPAASAAPRPISLRHKAATPGRKTNNAGGSMTHSAAKWSPGHGSHGPFAAKTPNYTSHPTVAALTSLALDPAVAVPSGKMPRSPVTWRSPAPAQPAKPAAPAMANAPLDSSKPNHLSSSVPALVFSQIIPATQAAAARKMMPRELNPTAAKAAAAILQSSMLCLPKNGLGQGKQDNSPAGDDDDIGDVNNEHGSWHQLEGLSEAEEDEVSSYDSKAAAPHGLAYSAAAADIASKFPKQPVASSMGFSMSKNFMMDSEDEMDFTEPLPFDGNQDEGAVTKSSLPTGDIPAAPRRTPVSAGTICSTIGESSFSDLDVMGHFSEDGDNVDGSGTSVSASRDRPANRVRFNGVAQTPPAVVPLTQGGRTGSARNSADSSLTATLVSPSVDYYGHMQSSVRGSPHAPTAPSSSTAVGANSSDADGGSHPHARKHRGVRFGTEHSSSAAPNPFTLHSVPVPFKIQGSYSMVLDAERAPTFSWADDVEELPIPSLASKLSSASISRRNAVSDGEFSDDDDVLSDEDLAAWPAAVDRDMFDMEL
ncbi:hypothetical protein GGF46_000219 [Coemansia sp. RSA 552]|nr:hypothetical protein GGF46_000219 [Coemansia sp. RSA 552]